MLTWKNSKNLAGAMALTALSLSILNPVQSHAKAWHSSVTDPVARFGEAVIDTIKEAPSDILKWVKASPEQRRAEKERKAEQDELLENQEDFQKARDRFRESIKAGLKVWPLHHFYDVLRSDAQKSIFYRGLITRGTPLFKALSDAREHLLEKTNAIPISSNEVQQYINNFKVEVHTDPTTTVGHLILHGYVHIDCANVMNIEFDQFDAENKVYPIRMYRYRFKDSDADSRGDCTPEKTRMCSPDRNGKLPVECVNINDHPFVLNGTFDEHFQRTQSYANSRQDKEGYVAKEKAIRLTQTGAIALRYGANYADDELGQDAFFKLDPRSKDKSSRIGQSTTPYRNQAGVEILDFKDLQTLEELDELELRSQKRKEWEERINLLVQNCRDAVNNRDREAFEFLVDSGLIRDTDLKKIESLLNDAEMREFEKEVGKASTLSKLQELIREIEAFGGEHDLLRERAVALLQTIAEKAREIETTKDSISFESKQFRVVQQALAAALRLDPGNSDVRNALSEFKRLEFIRKAEIAGETGDLFSLDIINRDAQRERDKLANRARRTRNPELTAQVREWDKALKPRIVPPYMTVGTAFHEIYNNAQQRVHERSIREMMDGYVTGGQNASYLPGYNYNQVAGGGRLPWLNSAF